LRDKTRIFAGISLGLGIIILVSGGERRVNPVKKLWSVAAVIFFLVIFLSYNPAVAFNDEATLYLAQATQEAADKQSETPVGDEILAQAKGAEEVEEDEYDDEYDDEDEYGDEEDVELIPDPWIEMNQGLYTFNDRLYFWLLKPVSRGYGFIIPEELRQGVRNFMYNIRFPVRFINALLQGKVRKSGYEFGQFFINSTAGCLGLLNPSANYPHLQPSKEDMGQTFAVWGIGNGAYIMLPFLGPSSLRDGMGRLGDTFLDPLWWLFDDIWVTLAIRAGEAVNDTSLRIGEYEALKEAALDPYIMIRNAYIQNRNKLIAE
jgi:phospholipid-binding lipoprotein MlaA